MSDQEWPSAPGSDEGTGRPPQSTPPPQPSSAGDPPPSANPPPAAPPPGSPAPGSPAPGSPPPPPGPTPSSGGYQQTAAQGATPGLGMRLLGRIIDAFIVGIPMGILFALIPGLAVGGLVYSFITAIVGFAYFVWMESNMGATVGKRLLRMTVVGSAGGNLSMEASARRNWWLLIGVLSGIPVLGILASLASLAVVIYIAVTINSDPNNRGWHDQMADAAVVPA